jgi:hypothetical protein
MKNMNFKARKSHRIPDNKFRQEICIEVGTNFRSGANT